MLIGFSIIWLVLLVVFIVVEAVTFGLVSIWFGAGSLAALIVSFFTPSLLTQTIVFFAVSFILILATFPLVKKFRYRKQEPTNADRNIGRQGVVIARITPSVHGRVKIDGVDWAARSYATLEEGDLCVVQSIDSTTVYVLPAPNNSYANV